MDKIRLIDEVQKRPELWDSEKKRTHPRFVFKMWEEVAASVGSNVTGMECKLKWQMLRSDYCSAIIRTERRIQRDKSNGIYNPRNSYDCKGVWFKRMSFLRQIINQRSTYMNKGGDDSQHSSETDTKDYIETQAEMDSLNEVGSNGAKMYCKKKRNASKKQQPAQAENFSPPSLLTKLGFSPQSTSQCRTDTDDNPALRHCAYGQKYYSHDIKRAQKFNNSTILNIKNFNELVFANDFDYNFLVSCVAKMKMMNKLQNLQFRAKITDLMMNILSPSMSKDPKISHDSKEKNSMKSMILDIKLSNNSVYAGDPDYHFLVSCLPQMKNMSKLQNIEFRAKASNLLLIILAPSIAEHCAPVSFSQRINNSSFINKL